MSDSFVGNTGVLTTVVQENSGGAPLYEAKANMTVSRMISFFKIPVFELTRTTHDAKTVYIKFLSSWKKIFSPFLTLCNKDD